MTGPWKYVVEVPDSKDIYVQPEFGVPFNYKVPTNPFKEEDEIFVQFAGKLKKKHL